MRTCAPRTRVSSSRAPLLRVGPEPLRRSATRDARGAAAAREAARGRAFSTAPRGKSGARRWRRATGTSSSSSLSTTSSAASSSSELGSARLRADILPARSAAQPGHEAGRGAHEELGGPRLRALGLRTTWRRASRCYSRCSGGPCVCAAARQAPAGEHRLASGATKHSFSSGAQQLRCFTKPKAPVVQGLPPSLLSQKPQHPPPRGRSGAAQFRR